MSTYDGIDEFIAVAAAGSFTRAAKAMGVSTTHVSRSIMALEQRINAQLLHRTTRAVGLTDTGRVFLERCERIAQERDEAIALVGERGEVQGELRVTCSTAMGDRFVAPILRTLAVDHPRLSVSIELTNRVIDLIAEGFDLAVRTGNVTDPRLIATPVASRSLYTCAAPAYLERAGKPMNVDALVQHECITGTSATWHFHKDGSDMMYRPKGRFRCNSGHAVIEACMAGLGICQLPEFYVLPYLKTGQVVQVLEDHQPQDEPIWAVYPQRRHLSPRVRRAIEMLQDRLPVLLNGHHS